MPPPQVTVVGSVNVDLVAQVPSLPEPGQTLTAAQLSRAPGGKGANQALAATRLGARVRLVAAVGDDAFAEQALALLRAERVELDVVTAAEPTGLALITVDDAGETTIVVAPGANAALSVHPRQLAQADAVLTVLEVPDAAVVAAASGARGFFALNAAPARTMPEEVLARADLVVVNTAEHAAIGGLDDARCVAVTHGAEGATLLRGGVEVATARPPAVTAVDGTGAGDAFVAALVLAMVTGVDDGEALRAACATGALAATRHGAQPSLPTAAEVAELRGR